MVKDEWKRCCSPPDHKTEEAKCTTHCRTQRLLNLHQVHLSDPVFEISKTSQEPHDEGDKRDTQETQQRI